MQSYKITSKDHPFIKGIQLFWLMLIIFSCVAKADNREYVFEEVAPSFNCDAQTITTEEKMICNSPVLSYVDHHFYDSLVAIRSQLNNLSRFDRESLWLSKSPDLEPFEWIEALKLSTISRESILSGCLTEECILLAYLTQIKRIASSIPSVFKPVIGNSNQEPNHFILRALYWSLKTNGSEAAFLSLLQSYTPPSPLFNFALGSRIEGEQCYSFYSPDEKEMEKEYEELALGIKKINDSYEPWQMLCGLPSMLDSHTPFQSPKYRTLSKSEFRNSIQSYMIDRYLRSFKSHSTNPEEFTTWFPYWDGENDPTVMTVMVLTRPEEKNCFPSLGSQSPTYIDINDIYQHRFYRHRRNLISDKALSSELNRMNQGVDNQNFLNRSEMTVLTNRTYTQSRSHIRYMDDFFPDHYQPLFHRGRLWGVDGYYAILSNWNPDPIPDLLKLFMGDYILWFDEKDMYSVRFNELFPVSQTGVYRRRDNMPNQCFLEVQN